MTRHERNANLRAAPRILLLALSGALAAPAHAEGDDEVARLITPESQVSFGAGQVSGDSRRFGVYNGLRQEGGYLLGEFSVRRRAEDTGTWLRADGRNLGLATAELGLEQERQGDWRYFIELGRTPRYAPYEVHSVLQGAGSPSLSYPSVTAAQPQTTATLPVFGTERQAGRLGFSKLFLGQAVEFKLLFQNEDKKGQRLFGRGTPSVQEFLAEPIDSTTRQLDVGLSYTGERLQLTGGYYGSWFGNHHSQLDIAGGQSALRLATSPALPFTVMALPPDNLAHQLHLTGAWQFTGTTRGSFKLAYGRAEQTDAFIAVPAPNNPAAVPPGGLNLSGRSDLGGRLDTTLAQLGLTSRPLKGLWLLANLRYEDRSDKTAVARYINATNTTSTDGYNEPRSLKILAGKVEAAYQLPQGYRLSGGVDAEQKQRSMAGVRVVGYREKTDETAYRLELKRSLADAVSGALAYVYSERTGSDFRTLRLWDNTAQAFTTVYSNRVQPIYIADRSRNKLRLLVDWAPADALSLQFALEDARDRYGPGRGSPDIGPRTGDARLYSVDASYSPSERWRLLGWATRSETRMGQSTGNSTATYWTAALDNIGDAMGLGLRGKLTGAVDLGADLTLARDVSAFGLGEAAAPLPDIRTDQTGVRLFGKYALGRDAWLRVDYVFDRRKTNDWTWNGTEASGPYVYSDGSWLYQRQLEKVHFLGMSVGYSFR